MSFAHRMAHSNVGSTMFHNNKALCACLHQGWYTIRNLQFAGTDNLSWCTHEWHQPTKCRHGQQRAAAIEKQMQNLSWRYGSIGMLKNALLRKMLPENVKMRNWLQEHGATLSGVPHITCFAISLKATALPEVCHDKSQGSFVPDSFPQHLVKASSTSF